LKAPLISSGRKGKLKTKGAICMKDLRHGKYMAIPAAKFAGNQFLMGDTIYEVQNNTSWRRVRKNAELLQSA